MPSQKKKDEVKMLEDKLKKAKTFFLTDYRGLTHQQLETLRKSLKKAEGEFVVAKNTLMKIALKQTGNASSEDFNTQLNNPTATLFAFGDEIAPIKALADFIKANSLPKVKMGYFGGKVATANDFTKLSTLPGREVLLATLAMRLKSPVYGLHYALRWNLVKLVTALDNVAKKKPATS